MLFFTCNYPLVMSIRSTNVYEERGKALRTIIQVTLLMLLHLALGLHGEHAPGKQNTDKPDGEIFSKYLRQHLLPQIFFDLWPISFAVTLICVIERGKLMDTNNIGWFGLFQVIFEVTSGYGTVGLSFGNP